jgi:hypothetical protein
MQDADLLVGLAGIAGVFVGFGALISIRGSGASEAHEVAYVRMVVWMGLMVIVTSLVPVVVSRYGITGHELWLPSSLLFLVAFWVMNLVSERMDAERRAIVAAMQGKARVRLEVPAAFLWVPMHVALILVVLGLFPDLEPALYVTAVVLYLFMDGLILLYLVHSQGRPTTA